MRSTTLNLILVSLIIGLSSLIVGCGGLEAPPPPTVTRVPTETPTVEVVAQGPPPVDAPVTPAIQPAATSAPSPTATAVPTLVPTTTPVSFTPTPLPASMPTLTLVPAPAGAAVVREGPLNVRTGPGTVYPRIGQLATGTAVEITGRNEAGSWWQIAYPGGEDDRGWVSAEYIETAEPIVAQVVEAPAVPPTSVPQPAAGLTGKIVFQESSGGRIFIVNANGSGLRQLTYGLDPALSPDGTKVAFARWTDPAGIYLINVDGTGERLLSQVEQPKSPEWSLDGTKIAFSHRSGGSFDYYWDADKQVVRKREDPYWTISVADVATGEFADLSVENHSYSPSWSPDGWWVVYDGERGLMLADPTRQSERWQQVTYGVRDMSPDWCPVPRDDPWAAPIAYMVFQNDHWEIHTIMPNGQGQRRLTPTPLFQAPYDNVAPEWSPDGRWIAFLTDRRGSWEIWVVRPDGSGQQPLLSAAQLEGINFQYEAQSEQVLDWGP